ncbi:MAG: hypothetical protein E6Q71_04070 [Pseudomonas sp.]|nr:MAG: hypothetical protein E6Q71_04070 [Pseudomonas sp.]
MDKESLRKQLAEQMAGFSGEVVRYAAKPLPDRQPWKKKPTMLDEDYQRALAEAEARKIEDGKNADD